MLINLAFIKAVNGLFYFALDYIAALEATTTAILVRSPELAAAVRQRFPAAPVRVASGPRAAVAVWRATRRGEMTFTPSPHPIPGCSRQLAVVHDTFPFEGRAGRAKAILLFLALRTSHAAAGYINMSDARVFLLQGGLSAGRLRSTPNHMAPARTARLDGTLVLPERPVIGLFGTDSPKKDYARLFAAVATHAQRSRAAFKVYGQPNTYFGNVAAAFPDFDIALTDSHAVDLEAFVRSVDLVASAATREGFSRPTALALSLGIPCWIVDAPVYREFYGGAATFHRDVEDLGAALAALTPGATITRPVFSVPDELEQDFRQCIAWLKAQDAHRR